MVSEFFERHKRKKIAKSLRNGVVPKGIDAERAVEALEATAPKAAAEYYGLLSAKVHGPDGKLKADHGLVGCKMITARFASLMVQALQGSGPAAIFDHYNAHEMGDGSTAEATTDVTLVSAQGSRIVGTQSTGASDNIYQCIGILTADAAYTVIEHGLFQSTGAGSSQLMDRTKMAAEFTVASDDQVTWTYQLTVVTAG